MNATPPVSQTPIAFDPAQQSAAAAANSVNSGGKGQDFAAALSNAGPKPARKAAGVKPANAGSVGGQLPAAGNLSPPLTPPPTPPLTRGSASAAAAAAAIAGTVGGASIPGAAVGTAAPAVIASTATGSPAASISGAQAVVADQSSGSASVDSPVAAPGAQGATSPGAGFGLAPGLPVDDAGEAGAPSGDSAATPSAVPAGAVARVDAPANGAATGAAAAASTAQAGAAAGRATGTPAGRAAGTPAGTAAGAANKPTRVAATAAVNAATSGPTSTDGSTTPSTNTDAWTNTDASVQAVTAAAMSAGATGGTVAPGDAGIAHGADLSASPTDDLATPATGAKPPGVGAPNGPPMPAPAISVARPVAAVSAKAAAAVAAVTTLASASAADKRASGGTGDSLLLGTSVDGAAMGAAQLSVNPTAVADATPTPLPTLKVAAGVDTPEFGHGLADRVSWMVDNNLNGAKLQVNPPQLGPIEVRIAVQGNHAQVWLTSHSAVTRDALESSSPKLREMLGAQGFGQVSVDISQSSYQERSAYSQPYQWTPSASPSASTATVQSTASSLPRISNGTVDAYA